eukprot:TRINITY_DN82802_c0_g1_i1.p1 TRINITY_DN82802_c0_g1~~TRINITY_DN82802_c0_g1_i1.p1  ORF type:complete len:239 (+),score=75.75 TRINITY_DN82802_c0_g1_i1:54-770(+)
MALRSGFSVPFGLLGLVVAICILFIVVGTWSTLSQPPALLSGVQGSTARQQGLEMEVVERHAALVKNMTVRLQTAEQALLDLKQAHEELLKKHKEERALRHSMKDMAKRGGGAPVPAPAPSQPVPAASVEKTAAKEPAAEEEEEGDDGDGASSEAEKEAEEKEQRQLIEYNDVSGTYKRFRPDDKCGSRVPLLPDEEVVECDPKGETPCCSSLGWCGKTKAHCRCATCIDYRKESGNR